MFDNHINLGKALRPFDGYEMDYALGTTYSLSLEALMFIPVTLFFGEEFNVADKVLTSEMFEALTKVPNHVQLFCQRGKIKKPAFYHNILAFWENSIEQVQLDSYLRSFHPKIWLVRYKPLKGNLPVRYKFICSSRNLTLCRDWDMAVNMEGNVVKKQQLANKPLLAFVEMLNSKAKRNIKPEILKEIMHIAFDLNDEQLAYAFHPIGFNNKKHPLLTGDIKQDELLVISPFLDKTTINAHKSRSKNFQLFSNGCELDRLDKLCLDKVDKLWMFHPLLDQAFYSEPGEVNNDADSDKNINGNVEPDDSYNPSMSLHAKLYISQKDDQANWFIGSANCTDPATSRNIEFLTEISFKKGQANINQVLKPLVKPDKGEGLFISYQQGESIKENDDEKLAESQLRKLIFELAGLTFLGQANKRDDSRFDLRITVKAEFIIPKNWKVSIIPLSANLETQKELLNQDEEQMFLFTDFEESQLTPFFLCTIHCENGLKKQIVLNCIVDFEASRMSKIFISIINNKDKLYKYLNTILSKDEVLPLKDLNEPSNNFSKKYNTNNLENLPLYEKLLLAASRDKSKIELAGKTLDFLKDEKDEQGNLIVEQEFADFFNVFRPFADEL